MSMYIGGPKTAKENYESELKNWKDFLKLKVWCTCSFVNNFQLPKFLANSLLFTLPIGCSVYTIEVAFTKSLKNIPDAKRLIYFHTAAVQKKSAPRTSPKPDPQATP